MQKVLGGQNIYAGKAPPAAHMHIVITKEVFEVRQKLLIEAFNEAKASQELIDRWLTLDQSFKRVLLKEGPNQCKRRFNTNEILHFQKPNL
jgi:hemoglobin